MFLKDILQEKEKFSHTECLIANYILDRKEKLEDDSVRLIANKIFCGSIYDH